MELRRPAMLNMIFFGLLMAISMNLLAFIHLVQWETQCSSHQDLPSQDKCKCTDCIEDEVCGGLWRANYFPGMLLDKELFMTKIHIVVAHCNKLLNWMYRYTKDFLNIASTHVLSKCGVEVKGAPSNAIVEVLPKNVGRNDHSFAHYITSILPEIVSPNDKSIVVFLKDSMTDSIH